MELEVSVLASGSSGNSIYIANKRQKILIDAGLSGKELCERLKKIGIRGKDLDAIFITHEHQDHIKGVGVLSRRFDIPVYANQLTWEGASTLGKIKEKNCKIFQGEFILGDLQVTPFAISHDANSPVGYIIACGRTKVGVATDMGKVLPEQREILRGLDLLVIEANHDLEMLMAGSYPRSLKYRIRGEKGHLSNDDTAYLLPKLINSNNPCILLAHLSQDNNLPELAYITIKNNLEEAGIKVDKDLKLDFAYQDRPTERYKLG